MEQFSTNEQIALEKSINIDRKWSRIDKTVCEYYDLNDVIEYVVKNSFKTVCLQFPDYMLEDSYEVAEYLNKRLENNVYIMADATYESCCVDYITAQHVNADAIIHFGPRCSNEWTGTIPCLCIYEKNPLNVQNFTRTLIETFTNEKELFLKIDTPYLYLKNEIESTLKGLGFKIIEFKKDDVNTVNVYLGEDNRNLLNYQLKERIDSLYYYDPKNQSRGIKRYDLNQLLLKRRRFLIETIKDSKRVGIIIATLVIKNFLKAIERVKTLLKLHGRKYYVLNVGKPTVAKLANFPEMDVYVLVCCPSSTIFESRDFYKPIVTIYDVEMALNSNDNSFERFNYEINAEFLDDDIKIDDNEPDVSLISGDVRWNDEITNKDDEIINKDDEIINKDDKNTKIDDKNEIVLKDKGIVSLTKNSGAEFLSERSFKGLEQKLGETEVKMAKEGRKGIAQSYQNEMF